MDAKSPTGSQGRRMEEARARPRRVRPIMSRIYPNAPPFGEPFARSAFGAHERLLAHFPSSSVPGGQETRRSTGNQAPRLHRLGQVGHREAQCGPEAAHRASVLFGGKTTVQVIWG